MMVFQIFLLLLLIYIIFLLSYSLIFGAPYAGIGKKRMDTMLDVLNIKKGERFLDIGSGDGRIVIEASRRGAKAYGIEINPLLVLFSKIRVFLTKSTATIDLQDAYEHDYSYYKYVTIWGTTHMLKGIEDKLYMQLPKGAKVASNHFKFKKWKAQKEVNDVYLYIK